jgi:hypothetical protein
MLTSPTKKWVLKKTVVRPDYGMAFGRFTQRIQGFSLVYNL